MFSYEHDDDMASFEADYLPHEARYMALRDRQAALDPRDPAYREPLHDPDTCSDPDCEHCDEQAAEQQGESLHFRSDSGTTDSLSQ